MNRGARHQAIFLDDHACVTFLALLAELPVRFGVRVHAYALMPNHFHLLLECPAGGLGRALQFLQSRYARWLNQQHGWDGPVWRGRYRSLSVDDDAWWTHLLAYLHLNPVAAHLAPSPDQARWTSHAAYVGEERAPDWLVTGELLALFGTVEAYRTYLVETQIGRQRGPPGFGVEHLWRVPRGVRPVVPAPPPTPNPRRSLEQAWQDLCAVTGLDRDGILAAPMGPGGNPARWLALDWLPRVTRLTRAELARELGVHPTLVSRAGRRVRELGGEEPLAGWLEALEGVGRKV